MSAAKYTGEAHSLAKCGLPDTWIASVLTNGRFTCRADDVQEGTREEVLAWLRERLTYLGAPDAAIEVQP